MTRTERSGPLSDLLYHYTGMDAGLAGILGTLRFRMSRHTHSNDPREFTFRSPRVVVNGASENLRAVLGIADQQGQAIKEHPGLATLDEDESNVVKAFVNAPLFLTEPLRVSLVEDRPGTVDDRTLLGDGIGHARMWAQYADDHKGICVAFDTEALLRAFSNHHLQQNVAIVSGRVRYNDAPGPTVFPDIVLDPPFAKVNETVDSYMKSYAELLYLQKATDWESEQEFRLLVLGNASTADFSISGTINAVCLGARFPEVYVPSAQALCETTGIRLLSIGWDGGHYSIETLLDGRAVPDMHPEAAEA